MKTLKIDTPIGGIDKSYGEPCECGECEWCLEQMEYAKNLEEDRNVDRERENV